MVRAPVFRVDSNGDEPVAGGQELGLRSGTENLPAIVGLGVAASLAGAEKAIASLDAERKEAEKAQKPRKRKKK